MIRRQKLYSKFEINSDAFFKLKNFGVSTITAYYLSHESNFNRTVKLVEQQQWTYHAYWLTCSQLDTLRKL